ncbi:MAG: type II toxin-antitoxin system death-on-curing family toxin [Thaumarchaeota archaeon]|nr:type II toxin-antitoxin system death-on-curing family toxin [Nitrososphaerota archaeon]
MNEYRYPTENQIIQLNKEVLAEIRVKKADRHKVLRRPAISAAIEEAKNEPGDIYDKAASLLRSLIQSHPFDSGNRRTAYTATVTFLRMNGEEPKIVPDAKALQGIRERFYTKNQVKEWLKGHGISPFRR